MTVAQSIRRGPSFETPDYNIKSILGAGDYGQVCHAKHRKTGRRVAIKKVQPFISTLTCVRTLREIKILKHLCHHENIVSILDIQKPQSYEHFSEIYIVQELMDTNLDRVVKGRKLLDTKMVQLIMYQIFKGLKAAHSVNIIHRDLKPANILMNADWTVKISEFGAARIDYGKTNGLLFGTQEGTSLMTDYTETLWYRAPEVMLSNSSYSTAVDMWSVGCILAELLSRRPLFPGKDFVDQLNLIFQVIGTPTGEDFDNIPSIRAKKYIKSLGYQKGTSLYEIFPDADACALDLLQKLLTFDPEKRITAVGALEHPFLKAYHDVENEPNAKPLSHKLFKLDKVKGLLGIEELKALLYCEAMQFESNICGN